MRLEIAVISYFNFSNDFRKRQPRLPFVRLFASLHRIRPDGADKFFSMRAMPGGRALIRMMLLIGFSAIRIAADKQTDLVLHFSVVVCHALMCRQGEADCEHGQAHRTRNG